MGGRGQTFRNRDFVDKNWQIITDHSSYENSTMLHGEVSPPHPPRSWTITKCYAWRMENESSAPEFGIGVGPEETQTWKLKNGWRWNSHLALEFPLPFDFCEVQALYFAWGCIYAAWNPNLNVGLWLSLRQIIWWNVSFYCTPTVDSSG